MEAARLAFIAGLRAGSRLPRRPFTAARLRAIGDRLWFGRKEVRTMPKTKKKARGRPPKEKEKA